jgi:hypothetical protein
MKWYLWVVTIILGLNAFVIVAVGLFLLLDRFRNREEIPDEPGKILDQDKRH